MKKIFRINLFAFLMLIFFIGFSLPATAEVRYLLVNNGAVIAQMRMLSTLGWDDRLREQLEGEDAYVDPGFPMTKREWVGMDFNSFINPRRA